MMSRYLWTGAALALALAGATTVRAQDHVVGTEDSATGFTGNFLESVFPGTLYMVASDGESPFHPFGASFDVSDGLDFSGVGFTWDQAPDSTWTNIGHQIWVIPATTACGSENEPVCEPVGHFISPSAWNPAAIGTWWIMESDGSASDKIVTFNTAAGAELLFYSDPFSAAPETSSWALMLIGFGAIGGAMRARRTTTVRFV